MNKQDMNHKQAELVSALMDGELDEQVADEVIGHLEQEPESRQRWSHYHLISDVMKGHALARVDAGFADRVSAAVADEPAILVPRRRSVPVLVKQVSGFAVAATVAIVAVLSVQPENGVDTGAPQVAVATPAENAEWVRVNNGVNWNVEKPAVESRLNAYLVNHNGYSSGVRGILPYAPIVSYEPGEQVRADISEPIEYKENKAK